MDLKLRARHLARRVLEEYECLRQLGARRVLAEPFARRSPWWSTLPLQRPLRIELPLAPSEGWPAALRAAGIPFIESMHTVYLEPATLALEPFAALRERYPADAALKISKHAGGIDGAPYARRGADSALYRAFSYNHRRLTLVANALHQHGIAPRLYDLLELEAGVAAGALRHAAYAVQHVSGRAPNDAEWAAGLARLRELEAQRAFQISAIRGYAHRDFARPHCNGNAWIESGSGRFLYVDFQNFLLCDHAARLAELAASEALPGFESDAGADVRLDDLDTLLCAHGGALADRLFVDASCGSGARMAHALRKGARWVHGFAPGAELRRAEERLFALGCTRFSLAPEESLRSGEPWPLPDFLRGQAARAIALVEAPSPALRELVARSPWSFAWTVAAEGAAADELARTAGARVLARAERAGGRAALLGRETS